MMWRDVITTDQNILQEDQDPQVEVLAAVFPSQLEAPNGTRGWEGRGWGPYHYETELTQEMTLFKTEVYRLAFKDGRIFLAPGATCEFIRRRSQACPDKYDADNQLVANWEEVQQRNLLATFPGKPPGVVIGSYPPGRWAHVRVTLSQRTPEKEELMMGKLFTVRAEVQFQSAPVVAGSVTAYIRVPDRLGPLRLYHRWGSGLNSKSTRANGVKKWQK